MPWSPKICQFCQKRYANKRALYNHLSEYIGTWRLPADGHHDALQLKQVIRRLYPSAYEADEDRKYRCWTCCKIITSRRRFTEHVIYRRHCGFDPESWTRKMNLRKWSLPFDEDTVLLREDPFPFLRLPPGTLSLYFSRSIACSFTLISAGSQLSLCRYTCPTNLRILADHSCDSWSTDFFSVSRK
jgi:hypothetical protein